MTKLTDRLAEVRKQEQVEEYTVNAQQVYNDRRDAIRPLLDELLAAHRMVFMLKVDGNLLASSDVAEFDWESADELIDIFAQAVKALHEEADDSDDSKTTVIKPARKPLGIVEMLKAKLDRIP